MKYQTTQKAIKNGYGKIICIGYCDLQNLLYYKSAESYTCGVYGWNANIYHINNNTCIVTGYRPFGNIHPDYSTTEAFENKAKKVLYDNSIEYDEKKKILSRLIDEYIDDVTAI